MGFCFHFPLQVRHNVKRGDYATLEGKDIALFESIVGKNHLVQEDLQGYNVDFLRSVRGTLLHYLYSTEGYNF